MARNCRTVALFAVSLCFTYVDSGLSRLIRPCPASRSTSAATKVLVMLATAKVVRGTSLCPVPSTPAAPVHAQPSLWTATVTPRAAVSASGASL
jgi:hypothetical protein